MLNKEIPVRKLCLLMLSMVLTALVLAGCSQKTAERKRSIALIMKASSNPFFAKMGEGAQKAADSLAVPLSIGTIPQETDINGQIAIVENMIVQDVGAILIAPADSKAIVNVLKKAQDQGILIINLDNRIDAETAAGAGLKIMCYVGVDNEEGGRMAGAYLVSLMSGKGQAAMLEGIRGVDNAEARKRGFLKAVQGTAVQVIASQSANWAQDQGLDVFANMLQANPHITGLFCANDMMALGAIQAIEQRGLAGKIWVTSYDNLEAARSAIRQNKLHATIDQHPERMGYWGVALAVQYWSGKAIPAEKMVPLDLVTKESSEGSL
jgi:ribose transport system substrate-binding protein